MCRFSWFSCVHAAPTTAVSSQDRPSHQADPCEEWVSGSQAEAYRQVVVQVAAKLLAMPEQL